VALTGSSLSMSERLPTHWHPMAGLKVAVIGDALEGLNGLLPEVVEINVGAVMSSGSSGEAAAAWLSR